MLRGIAGVCFQLVLGPQFCGIADIPILERPAETLWWLERTDAHVGWLREGEYYA